MTPQQSASDHNSDDDDTHAISDLEQFVGYNLKRAYVILQADFRNALGQDSLAPRVFSALSLVVQFPHITQSKLARRLGIERSGLVAIVDQLEGLGYLSRDTVPGDRRVQALVPTDLGREAYADALATVRAHERALLADLTKEEQRTLISLLRRIRVKGEVS
ncbi:Transcriptional regulator SlyA [Sulfitobacter sp. THAF37]|uniref:MarR family winged helix-turn-helix transcriptional regulator n=1 Tax=Sulfitobacter sp. THAF37 TaxID=2587855 RepID=UPI00126843B0|nr:MarR family transcriptional regulator [Sulfitobacter sp. THAF37]QFT59345.1 Transcriptional regulator SlyA [Sulfitobacter sp. THAF37]